ncbi:hypothetical protein OPKNFCMD_1516 [Methylobacterium crusticola]|uniref:Uncharacterized protein n=1 Tax=Methylobacterium crusticola TaxID=1697972 RepID=A0ABQ4QVJ7_9HYPH|nr:hypothetical protein [Methylobacterium crusticola]GJD48790.1 hypothetical protein OPKNFCMD_1516 [Methylobacterium crusticola]
MLEALRSAAPRGPTAAFPPPDLGAFRPATLSPRDRPAPLDGGDAVVLAALCLLIGGAIVLVALQALVIVQTL